MTEVLERELKGWVAKGMLVRIQGVISNLEAQRQMAEARNYPKIYNIELNADGPVTLLGARAVFEGCSDGELVEVIGYPIINIFRGAVTVQVEALGIKNAESEEQQAQRRTLNANLAALSSLKPSRNAFPLQPAVSVDLIHSAASSAQVDADFFNGLGGLIERCDVCQIPVRITSAEEIAAAIRESEADILVIIRGGGPESDFAVFNDAEVLSAMAEKNSYRVTGIGHSGNTTLLDLVADYSAPVPADAGAHIRDQLSHLDGLVSRYEKTIKAREAHIEELSVDMELIQDKAEKEIERLHSSLQGLTKSQPARQPQPANESRLPWMVACVLAVIVILQFIL